MPELTTKLTKDLEETGVAILPGVLSAQESRDAVDRLWAAAEGFRRMGGPTFMPQLDPNESNVRVFALLELDPLFRDLIRNPAALDLVEAVLGEGWMISNFTANIARPGSRSMSLHSDQALVVPEPWLAPWSVNIIWCLTDVRGENGGTLYIPGSHRFERLADVPDDALARLTPIVAPAGSIAVMDGRIWHTSGANVTKDEDRALLFGYYSADFLRPQVNWNALLSEETQGSLDPWMRARLGLDAAANIRMAGQLLGARPKSPMGVS
ncbi:MAG: phytanoyl-CoA dioxygenase family protein [Caulobacteraceae bacterium]|nr:phytanoyl-CoA dioxygenase family protein [Caulobacteraceae bacterium]